jgi:metal-responsive CopG/Arc/MetJ family transcriptional regulator
MRTTVSLPGDVFDNAERFARRAGKTRSQLYAEAITEYLARHVPDEVTENMNAVVDRVGAAVPDVFGRAAARRHALDGDLR